MTSKGYNPSRHVKEAVNGDEFGGRSRKQCHSYIIHEEQRLQAQLARLSIQSEQTMKQMEKSRRFFQKKYSHYIWRLRKARSMEDFYNQANKNELLLASIRPSKQKIQKLTEDLLECQGTINERIHEFLKEEIKPKLNSKQNNNQSGYVEVDYISDLKLDLLRELSVSEISLDTLSGRINGSEVWGCESEPNVQGTSSNSLAVSSSAQSSWTKLPEIKRGLPSPIICDSPPKSRSPERSNPSKQGILQRSSLPELSRSPDRSRSPGKPSRKIIKSHSSNSSLTGLPQISRSPLKFQ